MRQTQIVLLIVVAILGVGAGFLLRALIADDGPATSAAATQVATATTVASPTTPAAPTQTASPTETAVLPPTAVSGAGGQRPPAATPWPGIEITMVILWEEDETYSIDAEYPQAGLGIDGAIQAVVETYATDIRRLAQQQPPSNFGIPGPYVLDLSVASVYVGPTVASLRLHAYTYTGGAHGNGIIHVFNVDPSNDSELTLDDALAMVDLSLEAVAEEVALQLEQKLDGAFFSEGALPVPENYQTFVIGPEQVTFIFQQYQVAPYAAGHQEVSFPRADVSP